MYETNQYESMLAETVTIRGHDGDSVHSYFARPLGPGPFPGIVFIHHLPGWDEFSREMVRKLAHHGYAVISPDLYCRDGHGSAEDVAVRVRAEGGAPDARVVGDLAGALEHLRSQSYVSEKIGTIGTCSGARHAVLAASLLKGQFDAVVDLWGGNVVMAPDDLTDKRPVAPVDYTKDLSCPILGLFGEDDSSPSPEQVAIHEAALIEHGKDYEFHSYPGAGHGFFYYHRPSAYRAEQAVDGWQKILAFFAKHLK
jgi:carboxymethylenebutenolidase